MVVVVIAVLLAVIVVVESGELWCPWSGDLFSARVLNDKKKKRKKKEKKLLLLYPSYSIPI